MARPTQTPLSWLRDVRPSNGRCIDCGFLTRRRLDRANPLVFDEVPKENRSGPFARFAETPPVADPGTHEAIMRSQREYENAMRDQRLLRDSNGHAATIWCFVGAAPLAEELEAKHAEDLGFWQGAPEVPSWWTPREMSAVRVLIAERNCPKWVPHEEGFTPKEHLQELRVLRLEKERRELDASLAQMQVDVQAKGVEISKNLLLVQQQSTTQADRTARLALFIALGAVAIGLIAGAAQVGSFVLDLLRAVPAATPLP